MAKATGLKQMSCFLVIIKKKDILEGRKIINSLYIFTDSKYSELPEFFPSIVVGVLYRIMNNLLLFCCGLWGHQYCTRHTYTTDVYYTAQNI